MLAEPPRSPSGRDAMPSPSRSSKRAPGSRLGLLGAAALLGAALVGTPAEAITFLFEENFDDVPLFTSPTYGDINAWNPNPPIGWDSDTQTPTGVGILEWEQWAIVRDGFWKNFGQGRQLFDRGNRNIAVADPGLWNDPLTGDDFRGQYRTTLFGPTIDLLPRGDLETELKLALDVSWREVQRVTGPADPTRHQGNQTALIVATFPGAPPVELLRWESAPFVDGQGLSTFSPINPAGNANAPNPFHVTAVPNERIVLDVQAAIDAAFGPPPTPPPGVALASGGGMPGEVGIEIILEEGGDDGWFAIDNVGMASYDAPMLGDMYIDGTLDSLDFDEFANALLDIDQYDDDWFGEEPWKRGSLDGVFDFDDIPWFLEYMALEGVAPSAAFATAFGLGPVPEPSALAALSAGLLTGLGARRRGSDR